MGFVTLWAAIFVFTKTEAISNKRGIMKTLVLTSLMLLSSVALAQTQESSADLTCRAKAKEVALQTYSLCMSDHKSKQTEALRKAYEEEALKLKAQYESEIAKLQSSADSTSTKAPESAPAPVTVAPTISAPIAAPAPTPALTIPLLDKKQKTEPAANKGVSKVLPTKKVKTQYLPIQTIIEGPKVVNISTTLSPDLENE